MKNIIAPIDKAKLKAELTPNKKIRDTNKGSNEIYCFTSHDSPNLMKEVGRLRELSFRTAGGGTGKEVDIDEYDTSDHPYHQLIVWNPDDEEVLGGYRYILCQNAKKEENGDYMLATNHMFEFSEKFKTEFLPHTLELGRSFVQPAYQSRIKGRKSMYALDNLWDGLGALIKGCPDFKYFFGKITMYPHYNNEARKLLIYFLKKYFPDNEGLVVPCSPLEVKYDEALMNKIFHHNNYKDDYKILSALIRDHGETIPPLFNAYMNLSPSMKNFGTAINKRFGNVEETAILITVSDIYKAKTDRHISSYIPNLNYKIPSLKLKNPFK